MVEQKPADPDGPIVRDCAWCGEDATVKALRLNDPMLDSSIVVHRECWTAARQSPRQRDINPATPDRESLANVHTKYADAIRAKFTPIVICAKCKTHSAEFCEPCYTDAAYQEPTQTVSTPATVIVTDDRDGGQGVDKIKYKDEWPIEERAKRLRNLFLNNALTEDVPIQHTPGWIRVARDVESEIRAAKREVLIALRTEFYLSDRLAVAAIVEQHIRELDAEGASGK